MTFFVIIRNYERYFVQSQRVRRAVFDDYKNAFEQEHVDCILAPVVSDDPMTLENFEKSDTIFSNDDLFTVGANLAGWSSVFISILLFVNDLMFRFTCT